MFRFWILIVAFVTWTPAECIDKRFLLTNEVCYGDLGCFNTKAPFWSIQRPITFLPDPPEKVNTRFFLFTRDNRDVAFELKQPDVAAGNFGPFKAGLPTKFVVHGYLEAYNLQTWMRDMKSAFLRKAPMNVVLIDWGGGNKFPYAQASANAQVSGAQIARLIKTLNEHAGLRLADAHILGHSLGCHVAGYAGKRVRTIGRITGLDPAEPFFQYTDPIVRLDKTDADLVDIIHSDGSTILTLGLGLIQPIGDLDFYPNGGYNQPGCSKNTGKITGGIMGLLALDYDTIYAAVGCSHVRAIDYFTESIEATSCNFQAYPCANYDDFVDGKCRTCVGGSCPQLGFDADKFQGAPGSYYFQTGASGPPFCNFHYFVAFTMGPPSVIGKGKVYLKIVGSSGSVDGFQYNSDDIQFVPTTTYTTVVKSSRNLGEIQKVVVTFQKTTSLLTSWIYSDKLQIDTIAVTSGESQETVRLCPSYAVIQSGSSGSYSSDYC